jgi:hypothetical protein
MLINFDINCLTGLLQRVVVGNVASVSGVHTTSLFRIEVCRLVSCCVYIQHFALKKGWWKGLD